MSRIRLQNFENIARGNRNATVRLDIKTGQLRVRNDNFFNRVISWFQSKFGSQSQPLGASERNAESYAAYNTFLRAIGDDFYSPKDIQGIEAQFNADTFLEKDLSSRSIRQVIDKLHRTDCSVRRSIVMAAYFLSGRKDVEGDVVSSYFSRTLKEKISEKPALMEAGYVMEEECKQELSQRIFDAVMEKADNVDGGKLGMSMPEQSMDEWHAIAEKLMDETLEKEELKLLDKSERSQEADGTSASAREEPSQADFSKLLSEAKIPARKEVQKELHAIVQNAAGEVDVAAVVNQHTGAWVEKNRLSDWYHDAVPDRMKGHSVPQQLEEQVKQSLQAHKQVVPYEQAKAEVKAIVQNYVETYDERASLPETLQAQMSAAKLPNEVHQEVTVLIKDGTITDKESLAEHGNRNLADWVAANRVGKWYRERLLQEEVQLGDALVIPTKLSQAVSDAIIQHPKLWSYDSLKVHVRRIVNDYAERYDVGTRV